MKRPVTRGECASIPRPCPFVSCQWHLYLDVMPDGHIVRNHRGPVHTMRRSCALDVADEGEHTNDVIAETMNCTRQWISAIENRARQRMRKRLRMLE